MASKASNQPKTTRSGTPNAGRSALTGHYVLMPGSKAGSISLSDVTSAIKRLDGKK